MPGSCFGSADPGEQRAARWEQQTSPGAPPAPSLIGGHLTAMQRERILLFQNASLDVPCFCFYLFIFFNLPSSVGLLRFKEENSIPGRSDSNQKGKVLCSRKPFSLLFSLCCFYFQFGAGLAGKAKERDKLIINATKDLFPPDSDQIKFSTANSSHFPLLFEKRSGGRGTTTHDNFAPSERKRSAMSLLLSSPARSRESWSSGTCPVGDGRCWSSDRSQPFP